ncbi:MAG: DUF3857 and transglutaminase domain-containing protein [Pyrinomonadaceae bacterium]
MSFPSLKQIALLVAFCAFFTVSAFAGDDWRPVTAEERAMTKGKVEADADAEVIFWDVNINDSGADLVIDHYLRIKILSDVGREKFAKIDIPYVKPQKIKDVQARVTKPDGTVVEIAKADLFDREIIKANDVKVKAKSFAVPNIETGVVVEYKYREQVVNGGADNLRMDFQKDIPVQYVVYRLRPGAAGRLINFNVDAKLVEEKSKRYKIEMREMPAIGEEPNMPPEDEARSWMMIYYDSKRNLKGSSMDFWARVGGLMVWVYDIKDTLKPGKTMKAMAAEIIGDAQTEEEKIKRLFDFCKTEINNLNYDPSITEDALDEIKPSKDDDDTLKRKQGRSSEINKLFASLADAAGFETRLAFTGDRSKLFFNINKMHESFIHFTGVAIKQGNRWKYYDPGSKFLPFGYLTWKSDNGPVFLLAYKDYITTEIDISDYNQSRIIRNGDFTLSEDGTLTGTASVMYTGQFSNREKTLNYDISENEREERVKDRIKSRLSTAEVSDIKFENMTDPEMPFTVKYKVTVPNYAQKVGKRMFMQPGFFANGSQPRFTSSTRKYDIYFDFPWSETEEINIKLPEGYTLDNADVPEPVEDASRIGSLRTKMFLDKSKFSLKYQRDFHFGGGGNIFFRAGSYMPIKNLFDSFHKADTHALTLIQKAAE